MQLIDLWRPQGSSNPCYRRERVVTGYPQPISARACCFAEPSVGSASDSRRPTSGLSRRPVSLPRTDARTTAVGGCPSCVRRCSVWELQLQLDRLEARLPAQVIHQWIDSQGRQPRIAQTHRLLKPVQCRFVVAPLGVNLGVLISR